MKPVLALAILSGLLPASALSAGTSASARPRVALSVSPARLAIAAPGSRKIVVRNDGAERVVVVVGRRALLPQTARTAWLEIRPARLPLSPGRSAVLTLRARGDGEPGDHRVLVLLTTRSMPTGRVAVQVRLGVRVNVRMPGRVVRRLFLGGLQERSAGRGWTMFVSATNRGNVTLRLRGRIAASLYRHSNRVAGLRLDVPRVLPPHARTLLGLRYRGRLRGAATVLLRVRLGGRGPAVQRRYRVRL